MRRQFYHEKIGRPVHPHRLGRLTKELADIESRELVTPCRLLIVLIVSVALVLLIAVSINQDEFHMYDINGYLGDEYNITRGPYRFNYEDLRSKREHLLKVYNYAAPASKVEKRRSMPLEEFWDLYDAKWPVIIDDIVPTWKAYRKWSKAFFLENYGSHKIMLKAVKGVLEEGVAHVRTVTSFLRLLEQGSEPQKWTYMEDEMFLYGRPELRQDLGTNYILEENFFSLFPYEIRPWDSMMLWGTRYSRSPLHMDPYNWTAISAVIWGRKQWK